MAGMESLLRALARGGRRAEHAHRHHAFDQRTASPPPASPAQDTDTQLPATAEIKNTGRIAVVGGGISGLMAAKELVDKGFKVDVFEGGKRFGGKIQSANRDTFGSKVVNIGAEFIDSKGNPRMVALCNELGIKLIDANDQKTEIFHLPDGTKISGDAFHARYKPIHEQIIADKSNLIANEQWTERAKQLDAMSLADYLQELAAKAKPVVDAQVLETVARAYGSEAGRDPKNISALQFVNEASGELGTFLNSNCGYRIEGGTEKLVDALKQYLTDKGTNFYDNTQVTSVAKTNGQFTFGFAGASPLASNGYDKAVMALPAYALGKIAGLEALGVTAEQRELLNSSQYTHSSKFFVKLKDGAQVDNACFFSGKGFQSWVADPGMMTFLVGGETPNEKKGMDLVVSCLETYAKANGKKPEELFEIGPQAVVFGGPDMQKPCYCSPSSSQAIALGGLVTAFEKIAQTGFGIVGTFLPKRSAEGVSVGFMECGAESANRTVNILAQQERAVAQDAKAIGPRTAAVMAERQAASAQLDQVAI